MNKWVGLFVGGMLVAFHLTSNLESVSAEELGVGVQGGVAFASLSNGLANSAPGTTSSNRRGFLVGLVGEMPLAPMFYLAPELNLVQLGNNFNSSSGPDSFSANYLQLPILVRAKMPMGMLTPYVFLGPYVGYLLSSGDTTGSYAPSPPGRMNSFDIGFQGGVGTDIALWDRIAFFANARYLFGLTNVNVITSSAKGMQNRAFYLVGGFKMSL